MKWARTNSCFLASSAGSSGPIQHHRNELSSMLCAYTLAKNECESTVFHKAVKSCFNIILISCGFYITFMTCSRGIDCIFIAYALKDVCTNIHGPLPPRGIVSVTASQTFLCPCVCSLCSWTTRQYSQR